MKYFVVAISLLWLAGCGLTTTRPKEEMAMAAAAYIAAKNADAQNLAPKVFQKAEEFYLKAQSAYRRKYFNQAKTYAEQSVKMSEKAEFDSVMAQTLKEL